MLELEGMKRTIVLGLSSWALALSLFGCGRPPQIGENKEVYKAVDALYTAVGLRDTKLVEQCAARLKDLLAAGTLPAGVSKSLESIIAEAKGGKWESSQIRLSKFMEGQRR
jgi:hypothetical protein